MRIARTADPAPDSRRAWMSDGSDLAGAEDAVGFEPLCNGAISNTGVYMSKKSRTTGAVSGSGSRVRSWVPAEALLRLGWGRPGIHEAIPVIWVVPPSQQPSWRGRGWRLRVRCWIRRRSALDSPPKEAHNKVVGFVWVDRTTDLGYPQLDAVVAQDWEDQLKLRTGKGSLGFAQRQREGEWLRDDGSTAAIG